jgi:hypothetical protein
MPRMHAGSIASQALVMSRRAPPPQRLASREQVLQATHQWLKPLVHVLLSCGITWREFSELAKTTYVEVATESFGKRRRPTNVSRTSILTGLVRRDVRKQRQILSTSPQPPAGYVTKASLVLSAWHRDPAFRDKDGRPALLRRSGPGRTFTALIEHSGGADVRPSTLLKELVNAGAVRVRADGRLQALQRSYIPHTMDEELIRLWGTVIADVATTYVHNLTRTGKVNKRFERFAVNDRMPHSSVADFAQLLQQEGQAFLERVNNWLTARECKPNDRPRGDTVRLGVGLYHIEDIRSPPK